ncbi:uncharacterized protein BDR25DRAFT_131157 [Lindgomyces ingoldianus]|uniref:Uncharacterized protein n=1 Tax=Lindgomyces ingoldianus TaxID=673940 RepID=A0ACB6R494_9PLEO|nr:uncharacterized protein BDR25DRAFT_131157 [Lindgomyces ingoldianus]KAF2473337.1 hypothetical protein BDR25DRAFT_131157 [Lindgomyces ingoldianus]
MFLRVIYPDSREATPVSRTSPLFKIPQMVSEAEWDLHVCLWPTVFWTASNMACSSAAAGHSFVPRCLLQKSYAGRRFRLGGGKRRLHLRRSNTEHYQGRRECGRGLVLSFETHQTLLPRLLKCSPPRSGSIQSLKREGRRKFMKRSTQVFQSAVSHASCLRPRERESLKTSFV